MTTLLFIPGLLSDQRVWRPVAEGLRDYLPFLHADVTRDARIEDMAARLIAETDGPLIPVGHSMGGRVAMEIARQSPERVRALILANTGHAAATEAELPKREAKIAQAHQDMAELVRAWLPPMVAPERRQDQALMEDLQAMAVTAGPDIHERQLRALMNRPDAGAYLPSITSPVLLLTGAEDGWSPPAQHEEIASMLPQAQLRIVPAAGHFLPVERPDAVLQLVQSWLVEQQLAA